MDYQMDDEPIARIGNLSVWLPEEEHKQFYCEVTRGRVNNPSYVTPLCHYPDQAIANAVSWARLHSK